MEKTQFKMNLPNDLKEKLFIRSCMTDTSVSEEIIRILRQVIDVNTSEINSHEGDRILNMIGDINSRLKPIEKYFNLVDGAAYRLDQKCKDMGISETLDIHTKKFDHVAAKINEIESKIDPIIDWFNSSKKIEKSNIETSFSMLQKLVNKARIDIANLYNSSNSESWIKFKNSQDTKLFETEEEAEKYLIDHPNEAVRFKKKSED